MGLNGIQKHAISSVSNKITFLCDLYLSMSSLTMWVFDLSSSLDFLSLLFLTNYSRLYQKRYIVGTSIIENFFNVVSWSTIRQWKKVALLAVMLICRLALMNTFIFLFPKDVYKINIIFNTNDKFITNTGMYVKFLFLKCLFIYSILVLVWMLEQLIAFTCRLYMNGVVTTMK